MTGRLPAAIVPVLLSCALAASAPAAAFSFSVRALTAIPGAVLYPHVDPGSNMSCESCHYLRGANPYRLPDWAMQPPVDIDDTMLNNLCRHCHNDITAPFARTHSSLATSARYGDWTVECRDCHDPHRQDQAYVHGDAAHLVEGTVLSVTDNALTTASGGWADNEYRGLVIVPNIAQRHSAYKIARNGGNDFYFSSPIDTGTVAPGDTFAVIYGKLVRSAIAAPSAGTMPVRLFRGSGTNSLADGDATYDGVCEVCHTKTAYHRSSGQGNPHWAGERCSRCHTHATGFKGAAGGAHTRHATLLSCDGVNQGCHGTFQPPLFGDGHDIANTSVCDGCHSPGGSYDGVSDPAIGAKANWDNGVYAGNDLAGGKERWCATCHDEGSSVVAGIAAPNVIGDEDGPTGYGTGWGYYRTGHGLSAGVYPASREPAANLGCTACHDPGAPHVDNNPRTYGAADNNYQAGYRLRRPMDIPRSDLGMPASDFQLCLDCHSSAALLTQADNTTNFRKDPTMPNSHWLHLQAPATGQWAVNGTAWDSDWNGSQDSKISCPACHNVHGSVSPRMLRHGELISTPGTTDKVPAFNARYYPSAPPYPTLPDSTGLGFYPTVPGQGSVANTGVCFMCHANNVAYYRTVTNLAPRIASVHGRAGSNVLTVVFSERVYANPDNTGALAAGNFAFADADNGRTVTGAVHAAGAETALLTLSSALDSSSDVGVDTLAAATAGSIYDGQAKPMATTPVVLSGEGPYTLSLHPYANAYNYTGWNPQSTPSGGTWATVMDSGDGDLSYVTSGANMAGDTYYFTMDMDDAAALAPATIQSVTITVAARHVLSGSPYAAYVTVGYRTGATLVWSGPYLTDASGNYTEIPVKYTTGSDGGPLTPADIDNLQVSVMRGNTNGNDACYTRVTEIRVDVDYLYQQ